MKTVSVGTGAALALGARGEAIVVLVHAPASEVEWMQQGNGTERVLVMHNDFVIVGPEDDPAQIGGELAGRRDEEDRGRGRTFRLARRQLGYPAVRAWPCGRKPASIPRNQPWYVESGTGMGPDADDRRPEGGLHDQRSRHMAGVHRQDPICRSSSSAIPRLLNVYHVMPVNPDKFPNVKINTTGGKAFADFMVAADTQQVIGEFGEGQVRPAIVRARRRQVGGRCRASDGQAAGSWPTCPASRSSALAQKRQHQQDEAQR